MSPVQRLPDVTDKPVKFGERLGAGTSVALAAIGLEAEFSVIMDGQQVRPEDVFGSPRHIIRGPLMHRTGRSYHLPTGGAIYFDTGVIEIATPTIEIGPGCAARAGRSLWEGIRFLRTELDAWEEANGRKVDLVGFSAHYNVSFDIPRADLGATRNVRELAWLLTHLIPAPVMLLAANRRSTGIGVRPRGNRVEVTADFTPDPALMIAAATVIVGIVRDVMTWPDFSVDQLAGRGLPIINGFRADKHSSRKGWVANVDSFPRNPFAHDVNDPSWATSIGRDMSIRQMAREIVTAFRPAIVRYADLRSLRLIDAILDGSTRSLLELSDRPVSYEHVGRLCTWADLFPVRALPRSRYERVFIRAISGKPLSLGRDVYKPVGMRGWSQVVFRRVRDGTRHRFTLDYLLHHLDAWELGPQAEGRLRKRLRQRLGRQR